MSLEDISKVCFEKQIFETNKLGNALLSGLILEGIAGNKKNVTISSKNLKNLHEVTVTLKNEINSLK